MAVSRRLRYEILRRDDHTCRYCGGVAPDVKLTVDHVVPVALGGGDRPENLVTACAACNAGKSSSSPDAPVVEDVADDALRWAVAMEAAAEKLRRQVDERHEYVDAVGAAWERWTIDGEPIPRPGGWRSSIGALREAGLPVEAAIDLVNDTIPRDARDRFAYFCGAAWKTVRRLQDDAQASLCEPDGSDDPDMAAFVLNEFLSENCAGCGVHLNFGERVVCIDCLDTLRAQRPPRKTLAPAPPPRRLEAA